MIIEWNNNWWVFDIKDNIYLINVVNSQQLQLESTKQHTIFLLNLLKKGISKDKVIKKFVKKYPTYGKAWPEKYIRLFEKRKIISPMLKKPTQLSNDYLLGLDRQLDFLAEVKGESNKYEQQLTLKNSCVAMLGLGSLAHYTIMSLLSSGVGSFVCVDFDTIEKRNIGRQPMFSMRDLGKLKSEVVGDYIKRSREDVKVNVINKKLRNVNDVIKVVRGCDVVVHSCDLPRFVIHKMINEACLKLNIPNIVCYSGRVGPLCLPHKTACYGCLETSMKKKYAFYDELVKKITNSGSVRFPELAVVGSLSGILVGKEIVANYFFKTNRLFSSNNLSSQGFWS